MIKIKIKITPTSGRHAKFRKGRTLQPKLGDKSKELSAQRFKKGGHGNRKRANMLIR